MGVVYEAEHVLLKRPAAVKLIKFANRVDPTALDRFEQEVRATARLSHWNTVQIYDYGHTEAGTFYYAMELLPGLSLEEIVRRYGRLPPERAVHFLQQTCNALREAHAIGLIHRDIKPANIFAAKRGGLCDVAKLLDFGLVKRQTGEEAAGPRRRGREAFSGSPLYMAPEQAVSYSSADARSDIYSLGAVAYCLLTGRPPFCGRTPMDVIAAHTHSEVAPISHVQPDVPADLQRVVLRCLRKRPRERFPDAWSLRTALDACGCAGQWTEDRAAGWWGRLAQEPSAATAL